MSGRATPPPRGRKQEPASSLTPSAANAAEIAAMAVPFAEQNYGVTLDYGVASLAQLDGIIEDLRRDQRFEVLQPVLFSMGCYVGEVLVRHAGGRWRRAEDLGAGMAALSPIAVEMPDGRGCNPVGRVYRRFQKGREDGIVSFFHSLAGSLEGSRRLRAGPGTAVEPGGRRPAPARGASRGGSG